APSEGGRRRGEPRRAGRDHRSGGQHGPRHGSASPLGRPAPPRPHRPRRLADPARGRLSAAHFAEALRINPRLAHAQNSWGIVLARQGKWREALPHYEEALRLNPGYTEARLNLAVALERLGRST